MHALARVTAIVFAATVVATGAAAQTVTAVSGAPDYDSGVAVGPDGRIYVAGEYRGIRSFSAAGVAAYSGPANLIDARQMTFAGSDIATAELFVGGVNRNLGGVQRGGVYRYTAGCAGTPDAGGCTAERITVAAPDASNSYTHYGVAADATNVYATSDAGRIYRFPRATCTGATPCALGAYEIAAPGGSLGALQLVGGTLYVAAPNAVLSLAANCTAPCTTTTFASLPGQALRGLAWNPNAGLFAAAPASKTVYRIALDGTATTYVTDARFVTPANLAQAGGGDLFLTDFDAGGTFWRITPPPSPVPTLGEWAMIGLTGLIALGGAILAGRRRRAA